MVPCTWLVHYVEAVSWNVFVFPKLLWQRFLKLSLVNFFNHRFLTLSLAGQLTLLQKSSQPRHGYSSRRMEFSSVHVWNLQNCLWSTVPIKCLSHNFYLVDLRSGQYRDLPIISLWENMEIFPISHKPIETTQFFLDRASSPDLCRSGSLQIPIPADHREVT